MTHIPVLLQEVIAGLAPKRGETILDATVGGGGHSEAFCAAMGNTGRIVCLDADRDAIERSQKRLNPPVGECGCVVLFYETNFRHLDLALASFGIEKVNRILFDLGFSSHQLEESGRGFSFQRDEPLRMSFAENSDGLTAAQILNEWEEGSIATILESYGEERRAKKIAHAIVEERKTRPFQRTKELRELIERTVQGRGKIHPATRSFQALRIAVNDEFQALREALPKAFERLMKGGRMAVISFHSMEDRTVKRFFKEKSERKEGLLITKKPFAASEKEREENPRSRSAKLRIIEKI